MDLGRAVYLVEHGVKLTRIDHFKMCYWGCIRTESDAACDEMKFHAIKIDSKYILNARTPLDAKINGQYEYVSHHVPQDKRPVLSH